MSQFLNFQIETLQIYCKLKILSCKIKRLIRTNYFSPSFLERAAYLFGLFLARYLRWVLRSATNPKSPRRECLSLRFFFKCTVRSSIRLDKIPICTSGLPVSASVNLTSLIILCFLFLVKAITKR